MRILLYIKFVINLWLWPRVCEYNKRKINPIFIEIINYEVRLLIFFNCHQLFTNGFNLLIITIEII